MRRISVSKSPTFTGQVRDVFHQDTPTHAQRLATRLVERLPTCPIPEIARPGRTLRKCKDAHLAYFDTAGASNAPHRSHQRNHRAGQTRHQRLPQPHQLPTPNAPHRRRPRCLHPHPTLKSPISNTRPATSRRYSDVKRRRVPITGTSLSADTRTHLTKYQQHHPNPRKAG